MQDDLRLKYRQLQDILAVKGKVAVAFSGGVDSTLVLHAAVQMLGSKVLALHARMPWQSQAEDEHVRAMADCCGAELLVVDVNPLQWKEFSANPVDRCYWCKKRIFALFLEQCPRLGNAALVDGTNEDDLLKFRPGLAALQELGVGKPLAEAGLGKSAVRQLSKANRLPNWNLPPGSCLATRVANGEPITSAKLSLIRTLEELLQACGYTGCRARLSGGTIFLELQRIDIERFFLSDCKHELMTKAKALGVKKLYLDMEGRRELGKNGLFS